MTTTARFVQCQLRPLFFASGFLTSLLLCGCASSGLPTHGEPSRIQKMSQVIIKFKDPTINPARQSYLQQLSREIGATLVYVRPMSGGGHVFRIEDNGDLDSFRRVVGDLSKRSEIEYAEPDRHLYPMQH